MRLAAILKKNIPDFQALKNGANQTRTDDLLHAMQAFSQLNYSPICFIIRQKTVSYNFFFKRDYPAKITKTFSRTFL